MSDEMKIHPAPEDEETEVPEDERFDPVIEEILAGYRAQMEELYENRRRRAIARAGMTDEELVASLVGDLEAVRADAEAIGMEIVTLPEDGEGDGEEDEDE